MERKKLYSKKILSLFLAIMMLLSVMPYGALPVQAAKTPTVYSQLSDKAAFNYPGGSGATYCSSGCGVYAVVNAVKYLTNNKIDPHTLGKFAIKNGNRVNGGINGPSFARDVAKSNDFGKKYGFKCTEYFTFGNSSRKMICTIGGKRTSSGYPSNSEWTKLYNKLVQHIGDGEVAVVMVLGHNMAIVDYDSKNDKFLMLDSAAYKAKRLNANGGKYQWITADQLNYNKAPKANSNYNNQGPYIHLRSQIAFLSKTKDVNYDFNKSGADVPAERTNTTNKISATLNKSISYKSWGYYYGTDEKSVKACKNLNNDKCKYVPVGENGEKKTFSTTVKGLKPKKPYYYIIKVNYGNKKNVKSNLFSGETTNIKPDKPTLKLASSSDIGIGKTVNIKWNSAKNTNKYKINVNKTGTTTGGYEKTLDKNNNTYTVPGDAFKTAGTYTIKLTAINDAGNTVSDSILSITVHPNVTVEFYDTENKEVILTKNDVVYGTDVEAPPIEAPEGRTFGGWDKSLKNITANTRISTVYAPIKYTVRFIDGLTGKQLGKTQSVAYGTAADAPTPEKYTGYNFVGWDLDYTNIKGEATIKSIYKWYNDNYKLKSTVASVTKETDEDGVNGYEVSVKVINNANETVNGRCIIVLKSQSGIQLTTTESAAFTLSKYVGTRTSSNEKTITIFVPYSEFAYQLDVYTINDYEHSGPLAEPVVNKIIDNSGIWTDWIEYTGEVPVKKGVDYKNDDNLKTSTKEVKTTEYSYRTRSTKTSYDTSISGWTRLSGYKSVSQGQSTNKYADFNSGFDKSNSLYKKYNGKKKSNSENDTTIIKINSDSKTSYIYWHWCEGKKASSPANHYIKWDNKTSGYKTFHAFESTTKKAYKGTSYNAYVFSKSDVCSYNYNWNGYKSKEDNLTAVYTQKYTTYKKLYTYEQWSAWSDWTTTRQTTNSDKQEKSQVRTDTVKVYQYQPMAAEAVDPVAGSSFDTKHQKVSINTAIDRQYAGLPATVYIYKYTQTADYTNEYVGTTTIGSNGEVKLDNVYLREAPTAETGDFTISVAVEGMSSAIEVGQIEYERPHYTIEIKDVNDKTVKTIKNIVEGTGVVIPKMSDSELGISEGYEFMYWDLPTNKVTENLTIRPVVRQKTFNVVFIDWQKHETISDEYYYGQEVELPDLDALEGYDINWDLSDATKVTGTDEDGNTYEKYVITHNAVISADYEVAELDCTIIKPESIGAIDEESAKAIEVRDFDSNDILSTEVIQYGQRLSLPMEIEESPDYLFSGWMNAETHKIMTDTEVTADVTLIPVFEFSETCAVPKANVGTGEYTTNQTVTLSCETENAVIWYTTDNSDPATSNTAQEYTAPITLTKPTTLQFCAMALGMNNSGTVTELYAINTASSGTKYHLVTVGADIAEYEGAYYQALVKDSAKFSDTPFKNMTGYTYNGLFTDEEYADEFDPSVDVITEKTELFASYTPKQYTVTFKDKDGNKIGSDQKVDYMQSAEEPTAPTVDGYVFIGWNSDEWSCVTDNGVYTAMYVSEDEYAKVSLNIHNKSRMAGSTLKLKATVEPAELSDTELIWESSDPDVADVDENGVVSLLTPGEAIITVTVESTGEKDECIITVSANSDLNITIPAGSQLGFDSQGYIRQVPAGANTVEETKTMFVNENLTFFKADGTEMSDTDLVGTGTIVKLIDEDGTVLDEKSFIMTGDYDGDGKIQNKDVSMLSQYLVDKRDANDLQLIAMDCNGDGNVNVRDASMLSRYLVGKENIQ